MGLHKLLEKLQQKEAKMTSSVAHAEYVNQVHQFLITNDWLGGDH